MLSGLVLSEATIEEVVERHFKEQMQDPIKFSRDLQAGCLASIRKNHGIFCLSETCESVQMWSHYSDGHRGICIEMDAPEILNSAHQVQYANALSSVNFFNQTFESLSQQAMLTKQNDWAYAREWRIISPAFPPGLHRLSRSIVTGIILGAKISANDRERVLAWALLAKLAAPLYQSYPVPDGTRMEIRTLGVSATR